MSIISAEQARAQSSAFDLSQEQILEKLSTAIDTHSQIGEHAALARFLKSAVSQQELDGALSTVREKGYSVEMLNNDETAYLLKITW